MHTIVVADDHALFREGLLSLIEKWQDFEVVGEARDGLEAIQKAHDLLPDIILMDIHMPHLTGIDATLRIKRELPSVKVVMLTISEDETDLFQAIKAGASGYVLKEMPSSQLHTMLQGVLEGQAPISGRMAAKMLEEFNRPSHEQLSQSVAASVDKLTERERQVLDLLAQGLTNQEIGLQLHLSENTIKKYLHNVMEKLHLNNRVEAAMYAVKQGLV